MGAMSSREMMLQMLRRGSGDAVEAAFNYEVAEEQAAALGRMGRKAEAALAALRDHQGEGRAEVLKKAAARSGATSCSATSWACATAPRSSPTTRSPAR